MSPSIRHIGLVVADFEAAIRFWCETMGFSISRQMKESGVHIDKMMSLNNVEVTTAKLTDPNGNLLELLHFTSHPDRNDWIGKPYSTGLTHIALTVDNIDLMYERLQGRELFFLAAPQMSPDGRVKVTYARGPEGIILELVEEL